MRKLSPNSHIRRVRTALGESLKVISNTVEDSAGVAIYSHPFPTMISFIIKVPNSDGSK